MRNSSGESVAEHEHRWPRVRSRLLSRVFGLRPVLLEPDPKIRKSVTRIDVQPGVTLEVFWKDLPIGRGPCVSMAIHGHEVIRLDCLGPGAGHYHLAGIGFEESRAFRIYFPEQTIDEQVQRSLFELRHNLTLYLQRHPSRVVRRLALDAPAFERSVVRLQAMIDQECSMSDSLPATQQPLIAGTTIEGVRLIPLEAHADARGSFAEVFCPDWGTCLSPVQWSLVRSETNVMRGAHLHWNHDEYFHLIAGRANVGLRDLRKESPTQHRWSLYEFSAAEPMVLVFPRGLVHAWYFHEPSLHLQAVSEQYKQYHPHDNQGCRWDDPDLEIPWPCKAPILSERSAGFPPLRELSVP